MTKSKTFRPYRTHIDQPFLLPPDMREWLSEKHLAYFIMEVVEELDLQNICNKYDRSKGGNAAFHPQMMTALLIYAYCVGMPSSRKIGKATHEMIPFRVISGGCHPDHDTIADFRRRHLKELAGFFVHVLRLCQKSGLVKLGRVALDGTKVKANASKHKAMSYSRMGKSIAELEREVEDLLKRAKAVDDEEDRKYGKGKTEEDLPDRLGFKQERLRRIREAKAELEAEAKAMAQAKTSEVEKRLAGRAEEEKRTGRKAKGKAPVIPDVAAAVPEEKAQKNFTDPESRIMKDGSSKSFEQAYNTQVAVDSEAQVIVAADVTQETNDKRQLLPMVAQVRKNVGVLPEKVLADAGYFSEANVRAPELKDSDLYIPPDRQKHTGEPLLTECADTAGKELSAAEQMRSKLNTVAGHEVYRFRKAIVEPVFGQIKQVRGFRRFSFRGKEKVSAEWNLICLTHNLLKLFRYGRALQPA